MVAIEAPALPKPYYDDGKGIVIYCGDCREILPHLPKVDLVLTDPPYDISAGKGGGAFANRKCLLSTEGFTDMGVDYSFLDRYENWFCFCSRLQLPELISIASQHERWNLLTWAKSSCTPFCFNKYLPDVEFAVHVWGKNRLFGDMKDKQSFMLTHVGAKESGHPNEKPIQLIKKLIRLGAQEGETILDPFMGSGTTLVAAKALGRKCIGIELEERYCEIAVNRLAQDILEF